jgi:hypothetical protein
MSGKDSDRLHDLLVVVCFSPAPCRGGRSDHLGNVSLTKRVMFIPIEMGVDKLNTAKLQADMTGVGTVMLLGKALEAKHYRGAPQTNCDGRWSGWRFTLTGVLYPPFWELRLRSPGRG